MARVAVNGISEIDNWRFEPRAMLRRSAKNPQRSAAEAACVLYHRRT
ncbi:MAG: hypothetical protein ACRYG5_08325 [Janthinobacterium lividum]